MIEKRVVETCKYILSGAELRQAGEDLARATREAIACETDKKAAAAAYKARAEEAQSRCAALSLKITQGYEMRDLECVVYYQQPRAGLKQIVRPDTGEVLREEPMTQQEMQSEFVFDPGDGKKPQ
jgi:hypothetical protein